MKKLLLLIIFIGSVLHTCAHGVDSLQVQSAAITINSLSSRLEKLQHDYDYMYCDFEAYKLNKDLTDLDHGINIAINDIRIDMYNSRYDKDLYEAYLENYTASCTLLESLKSKIETVKTLVYLKTLTSGFTDEEINILTSTLTIINNSATKVQKTLNYYDVVLKAYIRKR